MCLGNEIYIIEGLNREQKDDQEAEDRSIYIVDTLWISNLQIVYGI